MLGDSMICGKCRSQHETATGGAGANRFARALLFGAGAALAGAAIYYAILAATGYSIGIIAIFVGYLVGRAVNAGSNGKGGRKYQLLAALLTYFAMSSTYLVEGLRQISKETSNESAVTTPKVAGSPDATLADSAEETDEYQEAELLPDLTGTSGTLDSTGASSPASTSGSVVIVLVAVFTLLLLAPILAGFSSPILLLITGFGVYTAWKMNRRISADISGPFNLRPAVPPPAQA